MHKAGALFGGDMTARQQRHLKIIAICGHRVGRNGAGQFMPGHCGARGYRGNAKRIRHHVA